jgi:hypothetical protein
MNLPAVTLPKPARIVGLPWYEEADFKAARSAMIDGKDLFATWAAWHVGALRGERSYQEKGVQVVRAMINPATFPGWCSTHGEKPNSQGRNRYAAHCAKLVTDKGA